MSIENPVELECPKCGHEQTVVVWESLNADVSPEARESLFEGNINKFLCESCGAEAMISSALMYHDMKRRFVVQFFPFAAIDDAEFLERFQTDGTDRIVTNALGFAQPEGMGLALEYMRNPHIVFDMGELVRYVLFRERVFDSRQDDQDSG